MILDQVRFTKGGNEEFYKVLRKRVNGYFKENNISKYANFAMVLKTIAMLAMYLVPFVLILTVLDSTLLIVLSWVLMAFGMAGTGLSVMHDANHHAYSKKKWVNVLVGKVILIVGGSDVNWRIQHNVLHHTYTNVVGMDEDIDIGNLMRFSPVQKKLKAHRFQHIYAWFLYGMMTMMWATSKDFTQFKRYRKKGLLKTQNVSEGGFLLTLILSKVGYMGICLGLPIFLGAMSWWATVLCFLLMHFIAGLILAMVFQPAHVVPSSEYSEVMKNGDIELDWASNQLMNTANFANKSRLFSWYVGGLNFQIEHHLFPNICHIHYKKIAYIVRDTAFEYNLPYYSYDTFLKALSGHANMLYNLGKYDDAPGIH